ncbi:hypothetical protein BH11PLA1_BH11PLA1_00420 [soil metagenome]
MSTPGPNPSSSPQAKGPVRGRAPQWNVVVLNDDDHSVPYVVRMLQELFHATQDDARKLTETIDSAGRAVVFTTHKELAELKVEQVMGYGRDPQLASSKGSMSAVIEPAVE